MDNLLENNAIESDLSTITESLLTIAADIHIRAFVPEISNYSDNLKIALQEGEIAATEDSMLKLYSQLHGAGSSYSPRERKLLTEKKGYACYPGGLSPLIKAKNFIGPDSVVADLGAGNGLQGLLLQCLRPHQKTIQIEISSEMIRIGRIFQRALGISADRIEWLHEDIMNASIETADFIYIYLPAKPLGGGIELYEAIANKLIVMNKPLVVFSVADCLAKFLNGQFSTFYSDGHLTCFVKE